ncbi:hypothetical protein [Bacillus thuringiensis]|nr:hypothetical protein [Bacillus thuringiensis]
MSKWLKSYFVLYVNFITKKHFVDLKNYTAIKNSSVDQGIG